MSMEASEEEVKFSSKESMIVPILVTLLIRDPVSKWQLVLKLFSINIASEPVTSRSRRQSEDQKMLRKWVILDSQMISFLH
jgi:hypothetical protein